MKYKNGFYSCLAKILVRFIWPISDMILFTPWGEVKLLRLTPAIL